EPRRFEVADVDVVVASAFRARDLAEIRRPAVPQPGVRPRFPLPGGERRRLRLPELRPGHDRPGGELERAAVFEQWRADHTVLAPDEMRRLVVDVRRHALDLELRR